MQVLPFILCGGTGTRLWPLSREAYPKKFHRLTGPEFLFQLTCRRLSGPLFGELSILSNHRYRFLVAEQLDEIAARAGSVVLEPVRKADNLMCVPRATSWSDIGSWSSVWDFMDKERQRAGRLRRDHHRGCARLLCA